MPFAASPAIQSNWNWRVGIGFAGIDVKVENPKFWNVLSGKRYQILGSRDVTPALKGDDLGVGGDRTSTIQSAAMSGVNSASIDSPNTAAILKANGRLGSYRPFSIALMVWRDTPSASPSVP